MNPDKVKKAVEFARQNPNSEFANELRKRIESGSLDNELRSAGLNQFVSSVSQEQKSRQDLSTEEKFNRDTQNAAKFIGLEPLASGLGQAITQGKTSKELNKAQENAMVIQNDLIQRIKARKEKGEDTTRLETALQDLGYNISDIGEQTSKVLNPSELSDKEVVGSAVQTAANFIPGIGKGANLLQKTAVGAGTGYAYDVGSKLQNKDIKTKDAFKPGVGSIVGGSLPVAGVVANNLIVKPLQRIIKGLGSATSGVGTQTIDELLNNPQEASKITKFLKKEGNDALLEKEVKSIVSGVSKIKSEASKSFGDGIESLAGTDIDGSVFRKNTQKFLDDNGIFIKGGKTNLGNVEFSDPKNIKNATELVKKLNTAKLDGKSLRKLADDIDNSVYKTATSDERISYNKFVKDLSNSLKNAINNSTDKLKEINKAYSRDIQIAEAVEGIFGDMKFKGANKEELIKISKNVENIFNQKGLEPKAVTEFFERIGQDPKTLRTGEAVRQITQKTTKANTLGFNPIEAIQQVTAGIITPRLIRDIAIFTGKTQPVVKKILENASSPARKALLNSLVNLQKQESGQ